MATKMNLSLLRKRIRAGEYLDDLHDLNENRVAFARWLVQQGKLNEWGGGEKGRTKKLIPLAS